MIFVRSAFSDAEKAAEDLKEICPWVRSGKVSSETALHSGSGLILYLDRDEYYEMLDELIKLERDAFESNGIPKEGSREMCIYKKYGWLWDFFYNAEKKIMTEAEVLLLHRMISYSESLSA